MYSYIVWDKKSDIKGYNEEYWLEKCGVSENDEVFLILNNGVVERVENATIIKSNFNLDMNLTCEQVAQEYLRIQEEQNNKQQDEALSLEEQAKKISTLEAENKKLNEINQEQDQLLVDNAYKITLLEMNMGGM